MGKRGYFSFARRELEYVRVSISNVRYGFQENQNKHSWEGLGRSGEKCIEKNLNEFGQVIIATQMNITINLMQLYLSGSNSR